MGGRVVVYACRSVCCSTSPLTHISVPFSLPGVLYWLKQSISVYQQRVPSVDTAYTNDVVFCPSRVKPLVKGVCQYCCTQATGFFQDSSIAPAAMHP